MILKCLRPLIFAVIFGFAALGLAAISAPAYAAQPEIYTPFGSNVAVGGYDAVAYFNAGKPTKGDDKIVATYKGATYRFANVANRDAFLANPAKYAPQYGGYCAWAVGHGYTAKSDPTAWKIVGGKLYLNYNADIQKKWVADDANQIASADKNWPKVLAK